MNESFGIKVFLALKGDLGTITYMLSLFLWTSLYGWLLFFLKSLEKVTMKLAGSYISFILLEDFSSSFSLLNRHRIDLFLFSAHSTLGKEVSQQSGSWTGLKLGHAIAVPHPQKFNSAACRGIDELLDTVRSQAIARASVAAGNSPRLQNL